MTPHTPEEWNPFVIVNNTMPPREKQAKCRMYTTSGNRA
jgi:hypothetical protein